ncbi:MAG: tetratricopeptide repeat protein [Reyranella sp.]|nr:tetratricopeptide repeat protein [Reyranella sp.]
MARAAKTKQKGTGRRARAKSAGAQPISQSDLDALLTSFMRILEEDDDGDEALDLAQEKAFEAMDAPRTADRIALAREALALSPLCSDAYLVLARETADADDALELYRRAVAVGAEALGETAFQDDAGSFWGLLQTRPYMRAGHELALALWRRGHRDEAVAHYHEMLRLNPDDNQGIRYLLIDALLELGREADADAVLKRYKDDGSAHWTWSAALLAFRRTGNSAPANKALAKAVKANGHVAAYLLGKKPLPATLPGFIGMGDESESVSYVHYAVDAWDAAPAAKGWVADAPVIALGQQDDPQDAELGYEPDLDRIDRAVLALLLHGLHDEMRAWTTFDRDALDRLHAQGVISNPVGRAKSVVFTEAGLEAALRSHRLLFAKTPPKSR